MSKASMRRYHEWVSQQPCANCGLEGHTQVAHYQGIRAGSFGRGMSAKANDLVVAPLCFPENKKGCHAKFDDYELSDKKERFDRKLDLSEMFLFWSTMTLIKAHREGVINV